MSVPLFNRDLLALSNDPPPPVGKGLNVNLLVTNLEKEMQHLIQMG